MARPLAPKSAADLGNLGFLHAPDATVILSDRIILKANLRAETVFGWSRAEMEGHSILMLYPGQTDYDVIGQRARRAMLDTQVYRDERFMRRKSGEVVWMEGSGLALDRLDPQKLAVWTYRPLDTIRPARNGLTPAEGKIARYLVNGFTSKEIALALSISHRTVEVHRANMIRKLEVRNSFELVGKLLSSPTQPGRI